MRIVRITIMQIGSLTAMNEKLEYKIGNVSLRKVLHYLSASCDFRWIHL